MKTKSIILALVAVAFLASCSVSKTTSLVKKLTPKTEVMMADLEVKNNKVSGEFKFDAKKNAIVDEKELIDNAIYEALAPINADVLVGLQWKVKTEVRARKYYTVNVTGYPAYYRNFRPCSIKDVELKEVNGLIFVMPKNSNGEPTGYQVVVPEDKMANYIDADLLSLDQLVFSNTGEVLGDGKVVTSTPTVGEEKKGLFSFFKKMNKKVSKKVKK